MRRNTVTPLQPETLGLGTDQGLIPPQASTNTHLTPLPTTKSWSRTDKQTMTSFGGWVRLDIDCACGLTDASKSTIRTSLRSSQSLPRIPGIVLRSEPRVELEYFSSGYENVTWPGAAPTPSDTSSPLRQLLSEIPDVSDVAYTPTMAPRTVLTRAPGPWRSPSSDSEGLSSSGAFPCLQIPNPKIWSRLINQFH